jgi:glycosyltransferase involved in cell wall biosynthesis
MSTSANTLFGSPKREISVILPVLNEEKYLADSVNSILSQSFSGDIEVILAVGPSHDKTMEIAKSLEFRDSRVVVVENPTGKTAAGLNLAIAASRYSIIVRVDGHSQIPSDYCETAFQCRRHHGR